MNYVWIVYVTEIKDDKRRTQERETQKVITAQWGITHNEVTQWSKFHKFWRQAVFVVSHGVIYGVYIKFYFCDCTEWLHKRHKPLISDTKQTTGRCGRDNRMLPKGHTPYTVHGLYVFTITHRGFLYSDWLEKLLIYVLIKPASKNRVVYSSRRACTELNDVLLLAYRNRWAHYSGRYYGWGMRKVA